MSSVDFSQDSWEWDRRVKCNKTTQGYSLRCRVSSAERVLLCGTEVLDEKMLSVTMSERNYHFVDSFTLCTEQN